ncbi:MAG: hypothetical protein IH886_00975 [Nitrospinae bacterium]|nr:hypothetical protein [Nitrospinota bacterium]
MRKKVEKILESQIDKELVKALLNAYFELKEHYYLGKHRPSELEGGRFCEVGIRCLQNLGNHKFTPFNKELKPIVEEVKALENAGGGQAHDSIRIHIPRILLPVNDVRNRRDVGHVNGDVNPNFADSTLVMTLCDWVLAELIRLTYNCSLEEAQYIVDELVERKIPIIQEFDGFVKILNPKLTIPDKILLLLNYKNKEGATVLQIKDWLKKVGSAQIVTALNRLENDKCFIHRSKQLCQITHSGIKYVEENIPFNMN